MNRTLRLSVVAAVAAAATAFVHAATPVAASMSLEAYAEIDGAADSNLSTDAWGSLLSNLGVGASAGVTDASGNSVSVAGYGNAGWTSANLGGVSFEAYGWDVSVSAKPYAVALTGAPPDWSYGFIAGATDARVVVDYDVFGYGDTFGLWGWSIIVAGGPEGLQALFVSDPYDPSASGSFVALLTPGEAYEISLVNNANVHGDFGAALQGGMNGNFRWEIQPVPEPQTVVLMALGLAGLVTFASRRRQV